MAAPDLTKRATVFVQKVGTDDAGYNIVGHPESRLTIAQALADLAAGYDAATVAEVRTISIGPGTYVTPAFALPPNVFIEADPDNEGGSNGEVVISLEGNITLAAAWSANAAAIGGFRGLTIRQSSSQNIDLTMPAPVAGNPARRIAIEDVRTDSDSIVWLATSTADALDVNDLVQDGTSADAITIGGGAVMVDGLLSAAVVDYTDATGIALAAQIYGQRITSAAGGVRFTTAADGLVARMGNCDNRALTLNETGIGTVTVYADATSIPLVGFITFSGTATNADLIRTTDMGGISPGGGGATGAAAFANAAGNSTITPTAQAWTAQGTFTGAGGTRVVILDVAGATLANGNTISLFVTRADGGGIVVEVRNATVGGTLLATIPDGTGVSTAKIDLVYGTIAAGGFAANSWLAQSFQIPATV